MNEVRIRKIFTISLWLKALGAMLEIIFGFLFLFTSGISDLVNFFVKNELIEDPTDFLATHIQALLPIFSLHIQLFTAFYLLSHGVIRIILVLALLRNKTWAYPTSLIFLSLLIIYQSIRISITHSIFLFLLTLFDMFVLWLIYHEYKFIKRANP